MIALIPAVALVASLLTFFTGFGLGTLLLPVFAAFFPTEQAVALTAIVHLANNLFKLALVGRHAVWDIVLRFGALAVPAALGGAVLLTSLTGLPPVFSYGLGARTVTVEPIALLIAVVMIAFVLLENSPRFRALSVPPKYLPFGGLLAGFFGGLSGHQGALRSAFLLKTGMTKEAFIATGVVLAVAVDIARLGVYGERFFAADLATNAPVLLLAAGAAFAGALLGNRLLKKVSLRRVELAVSALLVLLALGLGSGLL